MFGFLFIVFITIVVVFSKARECYECGKRNPTVYRKFKTIAYCDECQKKHKHNKIT